jgi:NitT/TauT family transport system substrate-binding protein
MPRPAQADDALSIIAGAPIPGIFDALDNVAQGAGFYKAEHLEITKNYSGSPSTCAQLIATGKGDVCAMSVEPILQGYEKGLRLQIFFSRQVRYSYVLGVLDDSPIRTLADFKGATIGTLTVGNPAEGMTQSMLGGAGLKRADYTFVPLGSGAAALEALVSKRVDALAFPYVQLVTYETGQGAKFRIFRHPILKDIGNNSYAALPATIQAKADVLKRFTRAIAKAALFIRINPAASARLYLEHQLGAGRVSDAALQNMTRTFTLLEGDWPAADPADTRIGYLSPQGLELYSQLLVDYGLAHDVVPVAAILTNQFVPFANDFDHQAVIAQAKAAH